MATPTTALPIGRYYDLLQSIPKGDYYAADGDILPFSDKAYVMQLDGTAPNELHVVMLNGAIYKTDLVTDANNKVSVSIVLSLGENVIEVVNRHNNTKHSVFITTRHWATWLASVSDILLDIDRNIETVHSNQYLNTVNADKIDEIFGRRLYTSNVADYELNTYRDVLINLYQAYRRYGGRLYGLMKAVSAFTQVNPLMLPSGFGKEWRLGADFLTNNYLKCTNTDDPDDWSLNGAGVTLTTRAGYFKPNALSINTLSSSGSHTITLYTRPKRRILDYKGLAITFGVWAHRINGLTASGNVVFTCGVSWDGGATWTDSSGLTVGLTAYTPTRVQQTSAIPQSATDPIFRVVATGSNEMHVIIDRIYLKVDVHTAAALNVNTVVRSQHHHKRGFRCFVWCPDQLTSGEKQQMGLVTDGVGHLFNITPTHIGMLPKDITHT